MIIMSKYNPLWKWINKNKTDDFKLTFAEIENIAGADQGRNYGTAGAPWAPAGGYVGQSDLLSYRWW